MKPNLLLAENFDPKTIDPTGYWMSEKFDGLRCYWNPSNRTFLSRLGNVFTAPTFFTENLPNVPLDGELWIGRGQFERTSSVVRSSKDKGWNATSFMVFDIPVHEAGPFEYRQDILRKLAMGGHVHVVQQTKCQNAAMLELALDIIVNNGGEGVMLRKPGSMYEGRRSATLLKYKRFLDAEAVVVGHKPGENGCAGQMGALLCLWNGRPIKVGTGFSSAERNNPPPIGATITFRYPGLTKSGSPKTPAFVRIRSEA